MKKLILGIGIFACMNVYADEFITCPKIVICKNKDAKSCYFKEISNSLFNVVEKGSSIKEEIEPNVEYTLDEARYQTAYNGDYYVPGVITCTYSHDTGWRTKSAVLINTAGQTSFVPFLAPGQTDWNNWTYPSHDDPRASYICKNVNSGCKFISKTNHLNKITR